MSKGELSPALVAPLSPHSSATDLSAASTTGTSTSAAAATANVDVDDTFELYDLRVEVVCPPGVRILCGAKPGDHFVLRGEMLHLPPGQGFSIYSLGALCVVFVPDCVRYAASSLCGVFVVRRLRFAASSLWIVCTADRFVWLGASNVVWLGASTCDRWCGALLRLAIAGAVRGTASSSERGVWIVVLLGLCITHG